MKRYEYLLFDADNTLFDFSLAEYISFGETCRKGDLPYSEELYREYSEITTVCGSGSRKRKSRWSF